MSILSNNSKCMLEQSQIMDQFISKSFKKPKRVRRRQPKKRIVAEVVEMKWVPKKVVEMKWVPKKIVKELYASAKPFYPTKQVEKVAEAEVVEEVSFDDCDTAAESVTDYQDCSYAAEYEYVPTPYDIFKMDMEWLSRFAIHTRQLIGEAIYASVLSMV